MAEDLTTPRSISGPTTGWTRARTLTILGGGVLLFLLTYLLAWFNAYRLTVVYVGDADASYEAGRYLDALTSYEEFNREFNRYVHYGGYLQIERIWQNPYAWPVPAEAQYAKEQMNEIIETRLTIEDAELFVQENIGQTHPYLGIIYLRLGELYEADGRLRDAEDIYTSIPDLFPKNAALIERAQANLAALPN